MVKLSGLRWSSPGGAAYVYQSRRERGPAYIGWVTG